VRLVAAIALAAFVGAAGAQPRKPSKAQCESYDRQLERNAEAARRGGNTKTMERLSEDRRRIQAARSKAGC
jgi:hypothetical protein